MEFANSNPEGFEQVKKDIRILYPTPTIWNSHCIATFNENGNRYYEIFNEKNESNLKYIYQMDKDNEGNIWNVGKDSIYKVIVGEDKFYKYQIDIYI